MPTRTAWRNRSTCSAGSCGSIPAWPAASYVSQAVASAPYRYQARLLAGHLRGLADRLARAAARSGTAGVPRPRRRPRVDDHQQVDEG
jgi:hypothetical protein